MAGDQTNLSVRVRKVLHNVMPRSLSKFADNI